MNSLLEYIFSDFFNTTHFLKIITNFNETLDEKTNEYSKDYRKALRNSREYKAFRLRLWKRILVSSLLFIPTSITLYFILEDILLSNKVNSGLFLMQSLCYLLFLFLACSVIIAPFFLNSKIASNNLDERTMILTCLLCAYLVFLVCYFFTYENNTVNYMFYLSVSNQYKIESILELIRTFLVFSLTAIVFSNLNSHMKSLPQKKTHENYINSDPHENK